MRRLLICLAFLTSASALADQIEISVGQTRKLDVGTLRGAACDDVSVVQIDIATNEDGQSNYVSITGLKEGATQCRVGNAALGKPPRIFEVKVVGSKPKPKKTE